MSLGLKLTRGLGWFGMYHVDAFGGPRVLTVSPSRRYSGPEACSAWRKKSPTSLIGVSSDRTLPWTTYIWRAPSLRHRLQIMCDSGGESCNEPGSLFHVSPRVAAASPEPNAISQGLRAFCWRMRPYIEVFYVSPIFMTLQTLLPDI